VPKRRLSTINGQFDEVEEELFEEVPGSEPADPDRPPGYEEGWREGMLDMLRQQIEYRFGPLTRSNEQRPSDLSCKQIKNLARRLLQTRTLDELWL
jgi:hypothetical protein